MADNEETAKATTTELLAGMRVHVPAEGTPLEQGVWYDDFSRVKAEAENIGRPMLAMWMNPGCGFCQRFAGNPAVRILSQAGVQNGIGNLVADFVGMSF